MHPHLGICDKGSLYLHVNLKGCGGVGQTLGSGGLEETPGGLGYDSAPRPRMLAQLAVRQAGALGKHQMPMVNGEFGLPEMSMLRCSSQWLLKACTNPTEIIPRNNSVLLSSGGGVLWKSPCCLLLSSHRWGVVGALAADLCLSRILLCRKQKKWI